MDAPIPEALNIQPFMIVWDINLIFKNKADKIDIYTPLFSLNPNKSENSQWIRFIYENDKIRLLSNFSKELKACTSYMIDPLTCTVLDVCNGFRKFYWNHSKWRENIRFVFEVEMPCDARAVKPTIWKRCVTEMQTAIKTNEIPLNLETETATETVINNRGLSCVVKRFKDNKTHKLFIGPETPSENWNLLTVMSKKNGKNSLEWRYLHTTDSVWKGSERILKKFEPLILFDIYELSTTLENMSEFEMAAVTSVIKPNMTPANVTGKLQQHHIAANLEESFTINKLCDITVQVGDHKIRAHKKILASDSTIWRVLFNEDEDLATIVIDDFDIGTIKQMIEYMYTGIVQHPMEAPDQLFGAAYTYEVTGLKELCEEELIQTISMENVVDMLVLADRPGVEVLFNDILEYIREYYADFMKLEDLKTMFVMNPDLAVKLFSKIL